MFREIPKNSKLAEIRDYYLFYKSNPFQFIEAGTIDIYDNVARGTIKPFAETIGEKTLGSGAFSTCISFGENYTLKLNTREDKSYKEYIKFCIQNKEAGGLPTIHYVGDWAGTFIVLLDRLEPVEPFHYGICSFIERPDKYPDGPDNYIKAREDFRFIEKTRKRLNRGTFWARTLKRTETSKYIEDDLQSANVMMKNDQFIFTDPWS